MASPKKHKPKKNEINSEIKRNFTWERTQILIDTAIDELAKELKRLPSLQEIADPLQVHGRPAQPEAL